MTCSARLPVYTLIIAAFIPDRTVGGVGLQGLVMFALYVLGVVGAFAVALRFAFALLISGYATVALFDRAAARSGMAPAHFARLRPPQMLVAIAGLALLLARVLSVA